MSKIYIVYRYGTKLYKVYWISQRGIELFHGHCMKGKQDFHTSHHKSGEFHFKVNQGQKVVLSNNRPLPGTQDIYNLQNFNAGDEDWANKYYPSCDNKKLKSKILIDTNLFINTNQIQTELYLVKPKKIASFLADDLFKQKSKEDYRLIEVVKSTEPWLVVHTRNLKFI